MGKATETEIIRYVREAYRDYPYNKINRIWLSLMACMNETIDCHGDNDYKIPHLGKERLERLNELPVTLPVTYTALELLENN